MTNVTSLSLKGVRDAGNLVDIITRVTKDEIDGSWNKNTLTIALWYYFLKNSNNKKFIKDLVKIYEDEHGKY